MMRKRESAPPFFRDRLRSLAKPNLAVLFALHALVTVTSTAISSTPTPSWSELLDRTKADRSSRAAQAELIKSARGVLEKPIIRRAYKLADVGQNRTWLDSRSRLLEDEIRETFALAMSDFIAARNLADELPLLGTTVRWPVRPESVAVLRLKPQ